MPGEVSPGVDEPVSPESPEAGSPTAVPEPGLDPELEPELDHEPDLDPPDDDPELDPGLEPELRPPPPPPAPASVNDAQSAITDRFSSRRRMAR